MKNNPTEEIIEQELEYAQTIDYTNDGKAIIEVSIKSASEFYSPFSVKNDEVLRAEINDYIAECENNIPLKEELRINIYPEQATNSDQDEKIIRTIRRNYADKIATINNKIKRTMQITILFLILGAIFITINAFLAKNNIPSVVKVILDILSWVFTWEALDCFVLQQSGERIEKKHYERLLRAEINIISKVATND